MTLLDELIVAHSACVELWTPGMSLTGLKGGRTLAGTYGTTAGINHPTAALFDGVSQQLQSSATIDLTATNKASLLMLVKFVAYDLAAVKIAAEFGNIGTTAGSLNLSTLGNVANDPLVSGLRGNVGACQAAHNYPGHGVADGNYHLLVGTYDMSLATNEACIYIDGTLRTADSYLSNNNNTANFGNLTFYLAARGGASNFANIAVDTVALFSAVPTADEMLAFYNAIADKRGIWGRTIAEGLIV